jgi:hypothetical protein
VERLQINDAEIEYEVEGNGEPVLLIAPARIRGSAAMGEGPRTLELDNGAGPDRAERGCVLT